ncbi:MAG: nucleotidyl transferase AbiEii/AbiGii toxin family protein [Candidatus Nanoarchaeia archaeon]|nr:nucleotidyl transferase AbiEii/AbiGii toxin family protein [Candidatus Nanoarchaeia archaeon]MDD5740995.1 nucleotidyl transferase AbiEii/AbiGii toxin family protein [Candidatus Nanoarchaeia archaeon]
MINNIISLLREILKEIEKNNPYELIGKGGTILSVYYLNHRDSQDLDFDCSKENKNKDFEGYFKSIFEIVTKSHNLTYKITKKASTSGSGRFHMNVTFSTYKDLPQTKMEINFIDEVPKGLLSHGKLILYPLENLFYQKLSAFTDRKEIKDIIDVEMAVKSKSPAINHDKLKDFDNIKEMINQAILIILHLEKNPAEWKQEFSSTELKFDVNEKNFPSFMEKTKTDLHKLKNKF